MTGIDPVRTARAIAATWPPEAVRDVGSFRVALGGGGGNRVTAAQLIDTGGDGIGVTAAEVAAVAKAQRAAGQAALFMVFGWQEPLATLLADAGYAPRDATLILAAGVAAVAEAPPPVSCFDIWPPLAVQEEIWAEGGIGPARLAVMARAEGPRTSIFGRIGDRPAGTAFVALDGGVAMLHALEVTPRARRQGLARTMVRAAAHWAAGQGATTFSALVTRNNAPALGLYASLGMEAVGQYHYRAQ
ncbi:GNAT family N-acetyltransferase [Roseicyclus sp.]|uniref:GNAT family N-acetyltransferase n=1 Tax=Roseicyclus sp. TaxID=1914329 RepID=UPI003FA0A047